MNEWLGGDLMPRLIEWSTVLGLVAFRIVLTVILAVVALRFLRVGLRQLEALLSRSGQADDRMPGSAQKRAETLTGILGTIGMTVIWSLVVIEVLAHVGLDVRPILAGAGILGLAVGFGAQNMVRDLISGFFIILEDQVRLGDVAVINGTGGLVEDITFRTIRLRDFSGVVHVFPNGTINTLSNMTKDWSAFVLDMGVAYKEDTDRVVQIMKEVGEELRADSVFGPLMIEPIEVVGVEDFADSAVTIRARIKTKPLQQWNIGREYRRRIKKAFDAQAIEIPFPHRTLYMGEASPPFKLEALAGPGLVKV
ncbi:MAG: mechanosensitive ion channel family protein [Nitrospira sp.]|nr:mechanosensitive ion channel family protein [Nitrospira sp.]